MEKVKLKKCAINECKREFLPPNSLIKFCSYGCARKGAEIKAKQKEKKQAETGKIKQSNSKRLALIAAQLAFNAFIRERDKKEPCISCGKKLGETFHAGHYYSGGGHSSVLFDEYNVNGQCVECNINKAGNFIEYGVNLEQKIGVDQFELLRERAYEVKKWEIDELVKIRKEYVNKLNELKRK